MFSSNSPKMEESKEKRIIMYPLPFPGHFNPMIHLAGILHRRGFSITILHTSFNYPHPSRHPNFTFRTINHSNDEAEGEDPLTLLNSSRMDLVALLRLLKQTYAEPFRKSLAAELSGGGGETVCCLISDAIWGKTTEEVGIRRVVLRTGGAASFCAFAAFPLLRDKGYLPLQECRADEEVKELPPLKVKDLPIIETKEPEELYKIINDMVMGVKSSSGVIWNTFKDLEESSLLNLSNHFHVPIFPIGPFHKHYHEPQPNTKTEQKEEEEEKDDEDFPIMKWLNKQKPRSVVYVSFGSLAATEEKEFHEIASGLRNCGWPFVWVVRPGAEWLNVLTREFTENIGNKGKVVKWVNQVEILANPAVGVFWTHCGWNSTLESICEGVPMICTPWFTDQLVNARYIVDEWRVGVGLERSKIDRKEIEKVIRKVMDLEKGDVMRERCLELKERSKVCLSKDGSSSKYLDTLVSYVLSLAL